MGYWEIVFFICLLERREIIGVVKEGDEGRREGREREIRGEKGRRWWEGEEVVGEEEVGGKRMEEEIFRSGED